MIFWARPPWRASLRILSQNLMRSLDQRLRHEERVEHLDLPDNVLSGHTNTLIPAVLTSVSMIELGPSLPTLRNTCPDLAALQASIAIPTLPSVEFLNPVGIERAEVNSATSGLAYHKSKEMVTTHPDEPGTRWYVLQLRPKIPDQPCIAERWYLSKNSQPAGKPNFATSSRNERVIRSPLLIWKVPLRSGSLIRPFHSTVVRGFSK